MSRSSPAALRIAIVDSDRGARARLRLLLDRVPWPPTHIVLEEDSAPALLERALQLPLDAIFADIDMPGWWSVTETMGRSPLRPELVFLTSRSEHAMRAFDLEAIDCLSQPIPDGRLIRTLERLWRRRRSAGALGGAAAVNTPVDLTTRQKDILRLLSDNLTNKEIARAMGLSHFTVRNHVVQLFRLFGVSRRRDLVRAAAPLALETLAPGDRRAPRMIPGFGV